MEFSHNDEATTFFLNEVGSLIAEKRDAIPDLWAEACKDTWKTALSQHKPSREHICHHDIGKHQESGDEEPTSSSRESSARSTPQRDSQLLEIPSRFLSSLDEALRDSSCSNTMSADNCESNNNASISPKAPLCKDCGAQDTTLFPFVSDVAPLAILMFLEAIQNHKELAINPMEPAYIPYRPEYLSDGMSFQVTRVPWQQVRADTDGRVISDAVYKRLKRTASRSAWLEFMKDLVVTHHMSYHVSEKHRMNVVQLVGLGWERVLDDTLGEPTLAPVIALEYAAYGSLKDFYYSATFASSYSQRIRILTDIAEGLQALHYSGIVHGDVKPENILICKDPEHGIIAKISDFGLSIIDPSSGPASQSLPGGTDQYCAPEAGTTIPSERLKYTDVYSFGIVVWQTLLGGIMPFFCGKYSDGGFLSGPEIHNLKTGSHSELGRIYDIDVTEIDFWRLNRAEELHAIQYESPEDHVNQVLVAMARDNLSPLCRVKEEGDSFCIPPDQLCVLLSIIQISLSSCPIHRRIESILVLLGKPSESGWVSICRIVWDAKVKLALVSTLHYQTVTTRARELYSDIFEQFFTTLQRNPISTNLDKLSHWDRILAQHLGSSLLEYYLWKRVEGDQTMETQRAILCYLALCSSTGSLTRCAAALGVHQFLGARMENHDMYTIGTALALLGGDSTLSSEENVCFQKQLTKGLIQRMQAEQMDSEQLRIAASVLMDFDVGPIDVDYQNNEGNTLLNLACQSGNFPLAVQLIVEHGASAAIANKHGEEPIHWLHQIPSSERNGIEAVAYFLKNAGADVEAFSQPRQQDSLRSSLDIHMFPTPLLRAVARRNLNAVLCLVQLDATIAPTQNPLYAKLKVSPLSLACAMLEPEILDLLLSSWETTSDPRDPYNVEVRGLWEAAIGGFDPIERVKLHGHRYHDRIRETLDVLTKHLGLGWLVLNTRSSLLYAVEGGDLLWTEALLESMHSDPRKAVLADIQKAIDCAVGQGHRHILRKLMEYGALPLLPHEWANHDFTSGWPGPWSEQLVDHLTNDLYSRGHICAKTRCSLHGCAAAGSQSVAVAQDILQHPVVNDCLQPVLADANDHGLPHYVKVVIEGGYPGLDRPDEEHHTPLYQAMAFSEFALAKYYLDRGASYQVDSWYLLAQLFEDGRSSLPQQIEFLLRVGSRRGAGHLPSFKMVRRVFGRMEPQALFTLHPDAEPTNWRLEEHNIITATAEACRGFNTANKKRCWEAVIDVYCSPAELLAECGDGRNAFEIAVDNADTVTLEKLLEAFTTSPSGGETLTILSRIRDLLLSEPPPYIADNVRKSRVIQYRKDLGRMAQLATSAGDKGVTHVNTRVDVVEMILERIRSELGILLQGVMQRGHGDKTSKHLTKEAEKFINAFMIVLDVSCEHAAVFHKRVDALKKPLTRLLAHHVGISFRRKEVAARLEARVKLTPKRRPKAITSTIALHPQTPFATSLRDCQPLLDFALYRRLVVNQLRAASSDLPLPNFAHAPLQLRILARLGFVNGSRIAIPGTELFAKTQLHESLAVRRSTAQVRQERPVPPYYHSTAHSLLGTRLADYRMEAKVNKARYFEHVVRYINPHARNSPQSDAVNRITELISIQVESLTDNRALTEMDPWDLHPLFGKMRRRRNGVDEFVDLPMQAYIDGSKAMTRRMLRQGVQFPPELMEGIEGLEVDCDEDTDEDDDDE